MIRSDRPSFVPMEILRGGLLLASLAALGHADDSIPSAFPKGRYETLRARSPFAVATVEAPPAPAGASFAANWFISGMARVGDNDFVTIKSRDLSTQFSLFGNGDAVNGVALASVTWSDAVGKSTVILRKGTETAKLEFNEADIRATPQAPAPAAAPPLGGKPLPGNPTQRNPGANPPAPMNGLPGNPAAPGPGLPVRRRAQVIVPPQ